MSPFQLIANVRKIFKTLKQDQKQPIIDLVNGFESMLQEKYKTDVIDNLLCFIISDFLSKHAAADNLNDGMPLKIILDQISRKTEESSKQSVISLAGEMRMHSITERISKLKSETVNNISSIKGLNTKKEINSVTERIKNTPSKDVFAKLLKRTLGEIKQSAVWKKQRQY